MAVINAVGNALTGSTGTGDFVGATSPSLVTPTLGVASATSLAVTGGSAPTQGLYSSGGALYFATGSTQVGYFGSTGNFQVGSQFTSGFNLGVVAPVVSAATPTMIGVGTNSNSVGSGGIVGILSSNGDGNNVNVAIASNGYVGSVNTDVLTQRNSSYGATGWILKSNSSGSSNAQSASLLMVNQAGTSITPITVNYLGNVTLSGSLATSQTAGIIGTTTNNNAQAGSVGEVISSVIASGSAVSLTTATPANVTSISLTAGDWDVWSNITFIPAATTNVVQARGWVSSTSVTEPDASLYSGIQNPAAGEVPAANFGFNAPSQRFSLSGTTTVYLSVTSAFTVDTLAVCGGIYARRRR